LVLINYKAQRTPGTPRTPVFDTLPTPKKYFSETFLRKFQKSHMSFLVRFVLLAGNGRFFSSLVLRPLYHNLYQCLEVLQVGHYNPSENPTKDLLVDLHYSDVQQLKSPKIILVKNN
jgi:hypothetical protein